MPIDQQSFNEKTRFTRYIDGEQLSDQELINFLQTWSDVRNGTSMPNWRQVIRWGGNATTNYTCVFRRYDRANISVYGFAKAIVGGNVREDYLRGRPDFGWGQVSNPGAYTETQADYFARAKFVQKYRERRTAFQGGVFLGELAETVQMIKRPAAALRDAVDRYRGALKERLTRRKRDRRLVQDSWLEFAFGVKPLVSDAEDAMKLATANPMRVFQPITAQGIYFHVDDRSVQQLGSGFALFNCTSRIEGKVIVKYKGAVSAENSPPSFPEQCGLSWSNVLPTVWELIPYSFLIDYFSNVGKVIEGVSTGPIRLAWGCKNSWKISEQRIENCYLDLKRLKANFGLNYKDFNGYATGGGVVGSRSEYVRTRINSVSLGIGDAQFKTPGSGTKWLNIAALVDYRKSDNKWLQTSISEWFR